MPGDIAALARENRKQPKYQGDNPVACSSPISPFAISGFLNQENPMRYKRTKMVTAVIYQLTRVETRVKPAFTRLRRTNPLITSADLPNERVVQLLQEHELPLLRTTTVRGTD